jgi:hypothetical protein
MSDERILGMVECKHENISCVVALEEHEHVPYSLCKRGTDAMCMRTPQHKRGVDEDECKAANERRQGQAWRVGMDEQERAP